MTDPKEEEATPIILVPENFKETSQSVPLIYAYGVNQWPLLRPQVATERSEWPVFNTETSIFPILKIPTNGGGDSL